MYRKNPWNKYEVALLIESYINIVDKHCNIKTELEELSYWLRNMAILSGKEIDDVYRNINGMYWQYGLLKSVFLQKPCESRHASVLFNDLVTLYQSDRAEFEKILGKAYMLSGKDRKEKAKYCTGQEKVCDKQSDADMKDGSKILRVNFTQHIDYSNTIPKRIIWLGCTIDNLHKWCQVYAFVFRRLYHAHTKQIEILLTNQYAAGSKICCSKNSEELRKPLRIADGFYAEGNMNATDTVARIGLLLKYCGVPFSDVVIEFSRKILYRAPQHDGTIGISFTEVEQTDFLDWLFKTKGLVQATCQSYVSNLKKADEYALCNKIIDESIFDIVDQSLSDVVKLILTNEKFYKYNVSQHNRFSAALKKYLEFKRGSEEMPKISRRALIKCEKQKQDTNEYGYQDAVVSIMKKRYKFGYRIGSTIEMSRFRKYASSDGIVLPESDDELKREILHAGFLIDDKVFIVEESTIMEIKNCFKRLVVDNTAKIIFFEYFMSSFSAIMGEHYITSYEMLRKIVAENAEQIFDEYEDVYVAKNFVSLVGRCTEHEAVIMEMKRVWGSAQTMQINALATELPCIPERYIAQCLSASKSFVWVSEGNYMAVDKLIITQEESEAVYSFVFESCEKRGYAPLSEIPLGNMVDENYELSMFSLLNAIYNKVLCSDFYLKGKILTKDNNGLDIVSLAKQYIVGRDECTFTEVNKKVSELSGVQYRYMAYEALYSTMVRVNEDHYVADKHVKFDVDAIDDILSKMITDGFVAIKDITTFAVFPMCGQAWNHYLLESYCYKFSKKYKLKVLNFNDKNAGMIVDQSVKSDYNELLARAAARSKIELSPENTGAFFFENGYMGKRRFSDLEIVTERAKEIREESNHVFIHF